MSGEREIKVPDLGGFRDVEVIDVLVRAGERIREDDSLITLESDKAAMDVPSPVAGEVKALRVKVGDRVSAGDVVLIAAVDEEAAAGNESTPVETEQAVVPQGGGTPDSGTSSPAEAGGSRLEAASSKIAAERPAADIHCELLVLGAGPGGYSAAFRAADLGRQVILVERHRRLGGVCLNVGCIPSKALLHAAEVMEQAEAMAANGVSFGKPKIDLAGLRAFRQRPVDRLSAGLAQLAKQRKVRVVEGTARFIAPHLLEVQTEAGAQSIAFEQAIIAAGSAAVRLPGQPEDPRIMDSTTALELEEIPPKLLVIGGGIIGLEMASVYAALGSAVTVIELTDGLIPGADRDLVRVLQKRLEAVFAAIHVATRVQKLKPQKNGIRAGFLGPQGEWGGIFDRVLVAVGRRSNGDRIGAEAAGVRLDERGFIGVDEQLRTSSEHIFAIGDIAGPPMLAHKASHEGRVAAEAACGLKSYFDARAIPAVAYTHPEIAWVGLTEAEAKAKEIAVTKAGFPWRASGRALTLGAETGMTKLLFADEGGRIVGAGIVGPNAGELIAELVLAIEMGCDAEDIALSIHPHPSLSESVGLAAEVGAGSITDLYLPRRR